MKGTLALLAVCMALLACPIALGCDAADDDDGMVTVTFRAAGDRGVLLTYDVPSGTTFGEVMDAVGDELSAMGFGPGDQGRIRLGWTTDPWGGAFVTDDFVIMQDLLVLPKVYVLPNEPTSDPSNRPLAWCALIAEALIVLLVLIIYLRASSDERL